MASKTPNRSFPGLLCTALFATGALGCSPGTDGGPVSHDAGNESEFHSEQAEVRIRALRERFQVKAEARAPRRDLLRAASPTGGVARFESLGDATHLHAKLPHAAKHGLPRTASVDLPLYASGGVWLGDDVSGVRIEFALRGANQKARVTATRDGIALYARALGGSDVVHRVTADGTEDFVVFETRPAREEIAYDVDVSRVAGLRLLQNTLEFLDESGTPALRVAPPYLVNEQGELHAAALGVDGCAYDSDPRGPWGRPVVRPGASRCTVRLAWTIESYPALVDPAWVTTGSMVTARHYHTATLLNSGQVLITGGLVGNTRQSSAELYNPAGSGSFAATSSMGSARYGNSATLLGSGKVLIAGGDNGTSAELYDPSGTGTFTATGAMPTSRSLHSATLLGSGKVLLVGGSGTTSQLASAVLFDPNSASFVETGSMSKARNFHSATLLRSGKVLVAGGGGTPNALALAELYDPSGTGSFVATSAMATARTGHTGTLLGSGKVLVAGGETVGGGFVSSAELFDPSGSGSFAPTGSLATARYNHTGTLLGSGKVLIAGGVGSSGYLASAEVFDPSGSGSFVLTAPMATARTDHTATLLGSGKVLVAGGSNSSGVLSSALLFELVAIGGTCTVGGECLTGYCSDGFCCDKPCAACSACSAAKKGSGANGVCGPILAGTDPNNACAVDGQNTCQRTGACNGAGACALWPPGTVCGASSGCSNGVVNASECDGKGVCTTQETTCAPYARCGSASSCASSCASDSDCVAAAYCDTPSATCKFDRLQGSACSSDAQCPSNHCVDQVCCETACAATCFSCRAAAKGSGVDGVCGMVAFGSDPRNDCSELPTASCGTTGTCDGAGACALWGKGTVCGVAGECKDTFLSGGDVCDGLGKCEPNVNGIECAPYACAGGGCKSACATQADCARSAFCDAGACRTRTARGAPCKVADECATTAPFCVDGVCCNAACTGQCEACDVSSIEGSCVPVVGAPHSARPPCLSAEAGSLCATLVCDGIDREACHCEGSATCDGDHTIMGPDGMTQTDCSPYKCDPSAACKAKCTSGSDCIAGHVCDASGDCIPRPSPPVYEGGCGCRSAGGSRHAPSAPAFVLAIAAALGVRSRLRLSGQVRRR